MSRWTAFPAALLFTLSPAAIEPAQDAREYSVDALLAALLIAGLLWYRREGRKALLCGVLFLSPLTQYGLAIFGAATLAVAFIASPPRNSAEERRRPPGSLIPGWRQERLGLALGLLSGRMPAYLPGHGKPSVAEFVRLGSVRRRLSFRVLLFGPRPDCIHGFRALGSIAAASAGVVCGSSYRSFPDFSGPVPVIP